MKVMVHIKNTTELTKFITWPKLPEELRHYVLTYCNKSTLCNYSTCSKACNSEIQRFNTVAPKRLIMKEGPDGIVVELQYEKNRVGYFFLEHYNGVVKKFMFSEADNVMEEIQKYLVERYKHVKQGYTVAIELDVKRWPIDLMKWKNLTHVEFCTVVMYKSMSNDFMDHLENQNIKVLTVSESAEISDRVIIPPHFFKSQGFQNLRALYGAVRCEIDTEDFMNWSKEDASLKSLISFDDIRAIVRKWNGTNHTEHQFLEIQQPEDDNRVLDVSVLFPSDQFHIVDLGLGSYRIRNVFINIDVYGKIIELTRSPN